MSAMGSSGHLTKVGSYTDVRSNRRARTYGLDFTSTGASRLRAQGTTQRYMVQAAPTEQNLTTKQVAELLGISPGRVRQLILEGRLPARKDGRDLYIRPADVELVRFRPWGRIDLRRQ